MISNGYVACDLLALTPCCLASGYPRFGGICPVFGVELTG